jgi:hypothetical protein
LVVSGTLGQVDANRFTGIGAVMAREAAIPVYYVGCALLFVFGLVLFAVKGAVLLAILCALGVLGCGARLLYEHRSIRR